MRVAAIGRTKILLNTIKLLHSAGHEIVLIGTCKESPEYGVGPEDFFKLASLLGSRFFNNIHINSPEIIALLKEVKADIAVSVNWLTLIGEEVISSFSKGILNAHAGDLPRYRGNACPNWAIIQNEKQITVSIHFMDPLAIDAGPVLLKRHFSVDENTRIGDFYYFAETNIPEMFKIAIDSLEKGTLQPIPQPTNTASSLRCYPRIPSDSFIDWNRPASYIDRQVRASSEPFAGAYTYWKSQKLIIWRSRLDSYPCLSLVIPGQVLWLSPENGEVGVACGEGVLVLLELQLVNQERLRAADLLKSTRIRLGMMVEDEIYSLINRIDRLEKIIGIEV